MENFYGEKARELDRFIQKYDPGERESVLSQRESKRLYREFRGLHYDCPGHAELYGLHRDRCRGGCDRASLRMPLCEDGRM